MYVGSITHVAALQPDYGWVLIEDMVVARAMQARRCQKK